MKRDWGRSTTRGLPLLLATFHSCAPAARRGEAEPRSGTVSVAQRGGGGRRRCSRMLVPRRRTAALRTTPLLPHVLAAVVDGGAAMRRRGKGRRDGRRRGGARGLRRGGAMGGVVEKGRGGRCARGEEDEGCVLSPLSARRWAGAGFIGPMDKTRIRARASSPGRNGRPRSRHVTSIGRPKIQTPVRPPQVRFDHCPCYLPCLNLICGC